MHEDDEWVLRNDKKVQKCISSGNGNNAMALGIP